MVFKISDLLIVLVCFLSFPSYGTALQRLKEIDSSLSQKDKAYVPNYDEIEKELERLMEVEPAMSNYILGKIYLQRENKMSDIKKGYDYMLEASRLKYVKADVVLGTLHSIASGYVDHEKSRFYFEKAAVAGDSDAMFGLYTLSFNNVLGKLEGVAWLNRSAEQGNGKAICFLVGEYINNEVKTTFEPIDDLILKLIQSDVKGYEGEKNFFLWQYYANENLSKSNNNIQKAVKYLNASAMIGYTNAITIKKEWDKSQNAKKLGQP